MFKEATKAKTTQKKNNKNKTILNKNNMQFLINQS